VDCLPVSRPVRINGNGTVFCRILLTATNGQRQKGTGTGDTPVTAISINIGRSTVIIQHPTGVISKSGVKKITGEPSVAKIVKTDALSSKSLVPQGLYVLLPYKKTDGKKIVKTDALIVELRCGSDLRKIMLSGTG
jgi:hypothetical protein